MKNCNLFKACMHFVIISLLTINALSAQHLFSVKYNHLTSEKLSRINTQINDAEILTLTYNRNIENKDFFRIPIVDKKNTQIILLNEQSGNHVVITPSSKAPSEFQLTPFFLEELQQSVLGNANRYLLIESDKELSVKSVSSVSAARGEVYIPQYFYGNSENKNEAYPQDRQIINIYKQKPILFPAFPDDPDNLSYIAQLEEEMSYYAYMYKLPDGTLCIYDYHFNPDNENKTIKGTHLQFSLSGSMNSEQYTATEYALDLWGTQLLGSVPVDISVSFILLEVGVLGRSFRMQDFFDDGSYETPFHNTFYPSSLWNQLVKYDATMMKDIVIEMNSYYSDEFYYGLDANAPSGKRDWVTIMLHEVTHGLGFMTNTTQDGYYFFVDEDGWLNYADYPCIYTRQLYAGLSGACVTELTEYERELLYISNNLYAGRPNSYLLTANEGVRVKMYAPKPYKPGSSRSHWDSSVSFPTFMKYAYQYPLHTFNFRKIGILKDLGWETPDNEPIISVTDIADLPNATSVDLSLTLEGTVLPNTATNKTIKWTIQNAGNTGATITNNIFSANATGTATVRATIYNGIAIWDNFTKDFNITVGKGAQTEPLAPTLFSNTTTEIILNTISDCEYRKDGGEWQKSTLFNELSPATFYNFEARKVENANYLPSPASPASTFSTLPLKINQNEFENIKIYAYRNNVIIQNESNLPVKSVEIFDVIGRTIYQNTTSEIETIINLQVTNGLYFVKIILQNDFSFCNKILIDR